MNPSRQLPSLRRSLEILQEGMDRGLHPGAQLFVWHRGRVVADLAVGWAREGVPMTPDTVTHWMSSVKPITAVAIAQLWERGLLELEDPVCLHIPEFGWAGKESVTVKHLLTHTGGFRSADRLPRHLPWDQTILRICQTPLEPGWLPGRKAGYHLSSSWFILAELVQRLSGEPFARYVRRHIFEPLGMHSTWLGVPQEQYPALKERLAEMHLSKHGELKPHPFVNCPEEITACRPGSNGRGPVRELGRFYLAMLGLLQQTSRSDSKIERASTGPASVDGAGATDARSVLKPETVCQLVHRHRKGMFDETFRHIMDWGLGFALDSKQYGPETVPYGYGRFSGPRTFGHGGALSSCAFADPDHELAVAWLCNGMPSDAEHQLRARELNSAIYSDLGLA